MAFSESYWKCFQIFGVQLYIYVERECVCMCVSVREGRDISFVMF